MFICLYGVNNIGKSTQIKRLCSRLRENTFTVEHIKYPIYDLEPTGSKLDYFLRDPQAPRLSGESFQMLYIQNRQDFEPELQRLLDQYNVVVAEDYVGTGLAWGMTQGVPLTWLEEKNKRHLTVQADLEILMDGERFLEGKEAGHLNEENEEEIDMTRRNLLFLAARKGWSVVNANQEEEKVGDDIWAVVEEVMGR